MKPSKVTILFQRRVNSIHFQTNASGAISPTITLRAGCPYTPRWVWGDGTADGSGANPGGHTYTGAGTRTITIILPHADYWMTGIDVHSCSITGDFMAALRQCRSLTNITAYNNTALNSHYRLADLPASMTYLQLSGTPSTITGALADLPAGMTYLQLYYTSSTITGALADLPAGMTYLLLSGTPSTITGALANLPASMTYLLLSGTPSTITGALADLPAGMTSLQLGGTSSTITGALANLPAGMTFLDLSGTSSTITGALADLPAGMTYLLLGGTLSTITGALADLPAGMTYLLLYNTLSTITGALANLPAGMTYLLLGGTPSTITGALADLPASMTYLDLSGTSSTITGGATAVPAHAIGLVYLDSTTMTQAQVDGVALRLYTDRAVFTAAAPTLNIGGSNPAPSGIYQDANPPTTGKEYIYTLVNDPRVEGFKKWSITYTA